MAKMMQPTISDFKGETRVNEGVCEVLRLCSLPPRIGYFSSEQRTWFLIASQNGYRPRRTISMSGLVSYGLAF
jgi:hypothetical protein